MIEITRDNYELYVLDYIEGNLAMDIHIKFEVFLSQNKDIEEELSLLPDFTADVSKKLDQEDILALKKGPLQAEAINKDNCDYYFTAYHEGDLSTKEKSIVDDFIHLHPDLKDDFKQIGLLVFKADNEAFFPNKKELKKAVPLSPFILIGRIAAVLILLLSIGLAIFFPSQKEAVYAARKTEPQFPKEKTSELQFTIREESAPEVNEKENTRLKKEHEVLTPATIEKTNQQVASNHIAKVGEPELAIASKERTDLDEKTTKIMEPVIEPEKEIRDVEPVYALENKEEQNASQTLFKIKKPSFRKKKEDADVYASNDETLIKIANPLKGRTKKDFSFGPIKVKRH